MKHEIAGTTIDVGHTAWFKSAAWLLPAPIFHRWRRPYTSRCGLDLEHATGIPTRFAIRFGRPCVRCWPELRRQRSLFARPHRRDRATQEALL